MISLAESIETLRMVGPIYSKRLKNLKIESISDLLHHYPVRYEDNSLISKISFLQEGERVTVRGKIISCKNSYTRTGKKIQQVKIRDDTGEVDIIWYNQPFLQKILLPGLTVNVSGKVKNFANKLILDSPSYEIINEAGNGKHVHTARLTPIYPQTQGVSSKWLRSRIFVLLTKFHLTVRDYLPESILKNYNLISLDQAIRKIHFPESTEDIIRARYRMGFDEILLILVGRKVIKLNQKLELNHFPLDYRKIKDSQEKFISSLPFILTGAQNRCVREILADLDKKSPMKRILQGDVGSGKTVVAGIIIYLLSLKGYQSALMAPTEILAKQHYQTLKQIYAKFDLKIALKTSSSNIQTGDFDLIIGTHALISPDLKIKNLALVVIDEQHKFGVDQRSKLLQKGRSPHLLMMTATPIPRTVAMTLFSDLSISIVDQLPAGRKKVKTWVVAPYKREPAYKWILEQLKSTADTLWPVTNQAFIICPLIDESDSLKSIKAVKEEYRKLSTDVFPQLKLGLLHGKLASRKKDEILKKFKSKKLHILVTTPIIEVGMDIPDANIMLIESSDRFGLAQLHQMRGRIGRNNQQAFCLLFSDTQNTESLSRLKLLEKIYSGIILADYDLKLRGPGELYGTRQHGLLNLKIADLQNANLLTQANCAVKEIIADKNLKDFPPLQEQLLRYKINNQKFVY